MGLLAGRRPRPIRGTAAGLAFVATVTLTASAPFLIAAAAPVLVGLAVGYGFGIVNNKLKEIWFEEKPQYFGRP